MSLYVDPTTPRHTQAEMLADMATRGFDFSVAAFRDWQSKGLLAAANQDQRWADGRPGSAKGVWSENQRLALVTLLGFRDRQRAVERSTDISGLANIVVWLWLYWDGIIELPQVRKALAYWVRPQIGGQAGGARSQQRIRKGAGRTVRHLAAPGSSRAARTAAADRLAHLFWHDDQAGLAQLVSNLRAVMDPAGAGRPIGSPLLPISPDDVALAMDAPRRAGHVLLTDPATLGQDDWDFARSFLRRSWDGYSRDWQMLISSSDGAITYDRPDVGLQMRSASRSVLTVVGLRLAAPA